MNSALIDANRFVKNTFLLTQVLRPFHSMGAKGAQIRGVRFTQEMGILKKYCMNAECINNFQIL
jgi:hypothetical protein